MGGAVWIMIAIFILVIILAVLAVVMAKDKKKMGPDYFVMFLIGLIWVPIGVYMQWKGDSSAFWIIGLIFLLIGLSNKKQWKKNHTNFNKLTKKQKRFALVVLLILGLILLIGVAAFYFRNRGWV